MTAPVPPHENDVFELRDFVENIIAPLHWVGPDGAIVWANQAELDLLGYSRQEYIGRHIADFHVDRPTVDDMLARLGRNETLRGYEARLRHKNGSILHVLISSSVLWRDGEFVHTRCLTIDVTERKRIEEVQRRAERNLSVQYAVTHVLADATRLDEATPRILAAIASVGDWSVGAIWTRDETDDVLRCADVWTAPDVQAKEFESVTRSLSFKAGVGLPGRVWATGTPIWIEDATRDSNPFDFLLLTR